MFVESSSSMATNLVKEDDVEVDLELCLSLGGRFKKTEKSKPKENLMDGISNGAKDISVDLNSVTTKREINVTKRKMKEETKHQRNGEEGECKRIRKESNGVTYGVELDSKFSKIVNGRNGSPISKSSSGVSDPSSSSHQHGGSCDFGENSGITKPVNNVSTGTEETGVVAVAAKETGKPPKPRLNGNVNGGRLLRFAKMPCVTSTGNGPEGKTVNGFLNQYSKSEISIICVCHGTSFSPAEFIIHAGGTHVSHPLRHITVVPSAL